MSKMAEILIIEDDPVAALSMARLLKLAGHEPQIAGNGYRGIEIARHQRPRYVLLDIALPGLDGYEVIGRLRQELAEPMTVIAITGYSQEEYRRRAVATGFDHYFLKPVDHDALFKLLSQAGTEPASALPAGRSPVVIESDGRPGQVITRSVEIVNTLGLHFRAADKIVRIARQFQANVSVGCDGRTASGRSILDLAILAAGCGARLVLEADGPDAEAAINALTGLIEHGFDELPPAPGAEIRSA
jgi:phosphotransferase system HPr (HPr) family protein